MFFLKKLLSSFLCPVPLCAGLLLAGLALWFFTTKWQKLGRGLIVAGTALLLLFGYPWLPRIALSHLENQYSPLTEDGRQRTEDRGRRAEGGTSNIQHPTSNIQHPTSNIQHPTSNIQHRMGGGGHRAEDGGPWSVVRGQRTGPWFIMVLAASGVSADANRSPAARFGDEGLMRIIEGVRLHRLLTNSTLLVSVPGPAVSKPEKERALAELLWVLGMEESAAQVCTGARDTEDEVAWCRRVVGTNRVVLVSSASHLPRAMLLARRHGLDATPAPSGYLVDTMTQWPWSPDRLFPSSAHVYYSDRALHEYLGLAWEKMKGGRKTEDGRRKTEDGGRGTEDGGRITNDRKWESESTLSRVCTSIN